MIRESQAKSLRAREMPQRDWRRAGDLLWPAARRRGADAFPVAAAWSPADDRHARRRPTRPDEERPAWRLVIHGGAGVIERARLTPGRGPRDPRRARPGARRAARRSSPRGGSALDAVEAAVRVLEDDPHFNAGRGSVFTYQGTIEMDASIMDGANRNAGAVTGVTATQQPDQPRPRG